MKCHRAAEECNFRLMAKTAKLWICAGCNTKGASLSRSFTWPPRTFAQQTSEWQKDFWLSITDKQMNPAQLQEHVVHTLTRVRVESEKASRGGLWLPLSKWAADGYDADTIERTCDATKKWSTSFDCWTYRPVIEGGWSETVEKAWAHPSHTFRRSLQPCA